MKDMKSASTQGTKQEKKIHTQECDKIWLDMFPKFLAFFCPLCSAGTETSLFFL